jgi:aryl-alcohol dehydrogenase-like predicted oxidoreductase
VVPAWLLAGSPVMVVISDTTKVDHSKDDIAAANVRLTKHAASADAS